MKVRAGEVMESREAEAASRDGELSGDFSQSKAADL